MQAKPSPHPPHPAHRIVSIGVCLIVTALILVPALVRAGQHFDAHGPVRTNIGLNWNSDAPRTRADVRPDDVMRALVAPLAGEDLTDTRVRADGFSRSLVDPIPDPPFVGASDTLRGPPAPRFS